MKRIALVLGLIAVAGQAWSQETPLQVHVGGRATAAADGGLSFGWPAVYFEGRFTGPEVRVRFAAPTERMRLLIDGVERGVFASAPGIDLRLTDLGPGEHVVRLEKMTESQTGGGVFLGFSAPSPDTALPPVARARQIEFIGDSFSAGYGNTSTGRDCTAQQVHDLTDTQRAFGPLVARSLDADYRINAYSGFGMARNYGGGFPDLSLPLIYDRARPDDLTTTPVEDAQWRPQLIVINLGTNDFSTPVQPGERWPDDAALRRAYQDAYVDFIQRLKTQQPQARFLLMGSDAFIGDVGVVADRMNASDAGRVVTLEFGGLELTGCDWHPSLADNVRIAAAVKSAIDGLMLWNETP